MNAYQKATILVSAAFLPLLLLFMKAADYSGLWIPGVAGIAVSSTLVYRLRGAQPFAATEHSMSHSRWLDGRRLK
jgi:hypothetical protein